MKKIQFLNGGQIANVTDRHADQLIERGAAILFEEKEEKVKPETKEHKPARQTKKK